MARGRLALLLALSGAVALGGCGDDGGDGDGGGMDAARDSGSDSGRDAGPADSGRDTGMDAGMDAGPPGPVPSCDPFSGGAACEEGTKCSVVITADADGMVTDITFGCVDAETSKAEGAPCSRAVDATPDDEEDNVLTDNCAEDLFCWRKPGESRNVCQTLCAGTTVDCGEGSFCQTLNSDPQFGTCTEAAGCDPVFQTGCEPGESCYVIGGTNGDLLGHCFEFSPPDGGTGMAGEPCEFVNNCAPGTQCTADMLADGGLGDTASCHVICAAATAADGGVDAGPAMDGGLDGGVPDAGDGGTELTGECPEGEVCDPASAAEGATIRTPTDPGFCF